MFTAPLELEEPLLDELLVDPPELEELLELEDELEIDEDDALDGDVLPELDAEGPVLAPVDEDEDATVEPLEELETLLEAELLELAVDELAALEELLLVEELPVEVEELLVEVEVLLVEVEVLEVEVLVVTLGGAT